MEARKIALTKLIDIEDKTYIEVEGIKRVYVISDEDLAGKPQKNQRSAFLLLSI